MCINPVNWRTDATPVQLHDTITVTVDTTAHVLVVQGSFLREEMNQACHFVVLF